MERVFSLFGLLVTLGVGAVALATLAKNGSPQPETVPAGPEPAEPNKPRLGAIPALAFHAPFSVN